MYKDVEKESMCLERDGSNIEIYPQGRRDDTLSVLVDLLNEKLLLETCGYNIKI